MIARLKKFGRTLKRDYLAAVPDNGETFMLPTPSHHTLAREMKICATLGLMMTGTLALFLPFAMAGGAILFGTLATPAVFVLRCREVRKEILKKTSAEIPLAGEGNEDKTATLTGAARDLNIVANTQLMVDTLTSKLQERIVPQTLLDKLAPYFNDCAEAASRLEATANGLPLDHIPLSRARSLSDDYGSGTTKDWREEVRPVLTRVGTAKKQAADVAAERITTTAAAIAATQDGIGYALTVKRIKLKVKS